MQEQSKREELLSEELLEWVTGAGNTASTSNNPGPGSFLECPSCQDVARKYGLHIHMRDLTQGAVDVSLGEGDTAVADDFLKASGRHHERATKLYNQMEAHGHPDLQAALRQKRQNYNPPL